MLSKTLIAFALAALAAPAMAQSEVDWATYGFDLQRSGYNPAETILSPATVGGLTMAWSFNAGKADASLQPGLSAATAQIGGQPLFLGDVSIGGKARDLVLFGDGNGMVYALNADATIPPGGMIWHHWIGNVTVTHGTTSKLIGVRSTLLADRTGNGGNGVVYVPGAGTMHALDLTTGAELAGWPVSVLEPNPPMTDGGLHDAPNLYNGQLYIGTAGYDDDAPPYFGRITSIDTTTASQSGVWYTLTGSAVPPTSSGGGVWGWGGVSIDPAAGVGGIYVATGNARTGNGQVGQAETIANLTPALQQVSAAGPAIGKTANGYDNDYGSTPLVFRPSGCNGAFLAAENKDGQLVVDSVGGDGTLSVAQVLQIANATGGTFHGTAAWDPVDRLMLVTSRYAGDAPFQAGLIALRVSADCSAPLLSLAWQTGEVAAGGSGIPIASELTSPVVANGLAYVGAGKTQSSMLAVATAAGDGYSAGQIMWTSKSFAGTTGLAPTVVNGVVYVGTQGSASDVVAFRLPAD